MKVILETPRLFLREFTVADAPLLYEMHKDPAITRYTGDPHPWDSIEATKKILKEIIIPQYAKKLGRWAVHLKDTDELTGWCGLKDTGDEVDLGYRYMQKYWGRGIASEAALAVLDFGLNTMKLSNIIGRADFRNVASVRVLEKTFSAFSEHQFVKTEVNGDVKYIKA